MACGIRVLLADTNEAFCLLAAELLHQSGEFRVVGAASCAAEALAMSRALRPDLLLTDVAFPDGDGFALRRDCAPYVCGTVFCTASCTKQVMLQAIREGVRFFLPRPFAGEELLRLLREAASAGSGAEQVQCVEETAASVLRIAGVPAHVKGWDYLLCAVSKVLCRPELLHRLTKELYPLVAKEFGTGAACVERNIRTAVTMAWLGEDDERRRELLDSLLSRDRCPGNGAFLAALVCAVRRLLREKAA